MLHVVTNGSSPGRRALALTPATRAEFGQAPPVGGPRDASFAGKELGARGLRGPWD